MSTTVGDPKYHALARVELIRSFVCRLLADIATEESVKWSNAASTCLKRALHCATLYYLSQHLPLPTTSIKSIV